MQEVYKMVKRKIEQVERLVDSLDRIDVNDVDFGKVVKHGETESHAEVRELSQKLRSFAMGLTSAEERYAEDHFMEDQLQKLYKQFDYDPEKIKSVLAEAMAKAKPVTQPDEHENGNHGVHHGGEPFSR